MKGVVNRVIEEIFVPRMKIVIDYDFVAVNQVRPAIVADHDVLFKMSTAPKQSATNHGDALAIRREFLSIKEWHEVAEFLSKWGLFHGRREVRWSEFQQWQKFVAEVMLKGFNDAFVFAVMNDFFGLSPDKDRTTPPDVKLFGEMFNISVRPQVVSSPQEHSRYNIHLHSKTILEAIAQTIHAEHIAEVTHRRCENCKTLFKVGSQPKAKFCSIKCKSAKHYVDRFHRKPKRRARG